MVSSIGYIHTRRDAAVLILVVVSGGLITQSFADHTKVQGKRQLENEWASTSKKDHKGPNTYEFRYDVENAPTNNIQYRMEERHPNGSVVGSYGQVQPDGKIRVVSYVADKDGIKTYVKDGGGGGGNGGVDQYVAEGSSLDPVQRVTSQIIQTAVKSQQQHKSPLHDKYQRPTPSTAAAAGQRVDTAHAYHQQRTNLDPATFRPEDSPGYQETNQPFVGDQLKDKLHTSHAEYQVVPSQQQQQQQFVQNASPLAPVVPYTLQGPAPPQQPTHYMLNVPPLPSLGDNSPLPLLPGQQPLPITPDQGPIMIQLQQPPQPVHNHQQQTNYQYQPAQMHQQQLLSPSQVQQYQQQPVRVQPPANLPQHQQAGRLVPNQLQQAVQYQPQQARVVQQQVLPPQYQQLQQQHLQQQQQLLQQLQQQQQQKLQQQQQKSQQQQQQPQQQQKLPYQQSVMQQPYVQQVNIPAHPSQLQVRGNVQQHHAVVPMQYFHQPNPATTIEQYRQQLQLQAAESQTFPIFMLPPRDSVFSFQGKPFRF
ncbi:putative mediator of RNA polymerase II transcription subunit 12 [Sipha flava]|uniref:Mediator of RNA polymerase II transcription subunit 12 n=1 Tax=Sipha flava TaxID=143950 RepID=A0A2S2RAD4_9HEMI|nr:putative mediator of RNA polymerase II transcription subunit 12 [Sipha flava]